MPRRKRVFVDGAMYHVYARATRREPIFADPGEAEAWIAAVGKAKLRDEFAVLAWCLMSNHFHLLLRTTSVTLWRSMRSIQGPFAQGFNRRRRLVGPVWQSRYQAKLVLDDAYLRRVIAYIHANPVVAGLVRRAEDYPLGGHREILGRAPARLTDPAETLRLFGETRRAALRAYRDTVAVIAAELHQSAPGPDGIAVDRFPDASLEPSPGPGLDPLGRSSSRDRPEVSADAFLTAACGALGVAREELGGPRKDATLVRQREATVLLGTERYALRLNAVAGAMGKSAESASRWVANGSRRRRADREFAALIESLDSAITREFRSGMGRKKPHE
jgi:putative transposase